MYKLIRIMTLGLIFCIVLITGCSKSVSTTINELKFENIKSVRIELAGSVLPGNTSPIKTYTFDFNNYKQTKIIENVIKYLNSAKVQGNADETVSNKGGWSPTFLILENKDGSIIQIEAAVHEKITKFPDGTEYAGLDIPNEVTVSINSNKNRIRLLSPEIRKLIDSGYKGIF